MESKHLGNGLMYGSFNPLHNSHVSLIEMALETFDVLHIFVRNVPADDIVDYQTKRDWLQTLGERLGGRLRVYPLELTADCFGEDGRLDMVQVFLHTEAQTGTHIDGMITGGDKDTWFEVLRPAFPDREFILVPRSDIRSHAIRDDVEALRDEVPDFVYRTLAS